MNLLLSLSALPLALQSVLAAIIGLVVGSFLNVLIVRLPKQLHYQWSKQAHEWLDKDYSETAPASLSLPASHCPNCKTSLKWWQNIPLISFLLLKGKCAFCQQKISLRYPLVELLSALLSVAVIYHYGFSWQGLAGLLLTWALIALSFIDIDHQLLPDIIILPAIWLALLFSLVPVFSSTGDAIIGAVVGYLFFFLICVLYKLFSKKQAMGQGDFKLLSLLGASMGWQLLPLIILVSSTLGSIFGLLKISLNKQANRTIPFGPFLAIAGWIAMMWGKQINQLYLNALGL